MGKKPDDKKSFQLYNDYFSTVQLMPDEEAGKLFKAILAHANGEEVEELSGMSLIAFSLIRAQMDRDAEKYRARCEANRVNGARGGRPRRQENKPNGFAENRSVFESGEDQAEKEPAEIDAEPEMQTAPAEPAKIAYSDEFEAFWEVYPRKDDKGQAFKKYKARLKNGYSPAELIEAARRYRARCERERTEKQYMKQAKTFLGDAMPFLDYLDKGQQGSRRGSVDERIRAGANPFLDR